MSTVIAAVDLGPSTRRVIHHAAGFARLLSCNLKVMHVNGGSAGARAHVGDYCRQVGPYEVDLQDDDIVVASGLVSEAIVREAIRNKAALVVVGSRGHGGVAKLILGSTSEAVLRSAPVPVLVVPPVDLDIVSIADRAALTCGPVLAAVDLAEECEHQLNLATALARVGDVPLLLMTVVPDRIDADDAGRMLRERAHRLTAIKPHAMIVRRGHIADEISRCALAEGSGLVVMGRHATRRTKPGAIAAAVLRTNRAFVLAVPGC
jgi:nucleotide-binding universal stress UspA family protein